MKKLLVLSVSFTLFFNLSQAQNWQPINQFDKYNYQIDTAEYITNTIWADSVIVIGEDSVFYLNRIMTNCDTCSNNINNYYALKNQPQFLMRKMIKVSDSLYTFQDTSEFIIKPLLHFGEQWTFNSDNNIQAIISFEGEDEIFGSADSVKHIALSNGTIIILSKNFGLLQFPFSSEINYNLIGIEGNRELGEQVPNFWNFFDYDVGDVFQREQRLGEHIYSTTDIKKYRIISKDTFQDSIRYGIEGWKMIIYQEDFFIDTTVLRINSSITYTDSANHFTNYYNHKLINISLCLNQNPPPISGNYYNKLITKKSNGFYTKEVCEPNEISPIYFLSQENLDLLEKHYISFPNNLFLIYKEGVGLYKYYFSGLIWGNENLQGNIHNGDTTGTVYSDEFFEQYSDINKLKKNELRLYPNPVKDVLHIDFLPIEINSQVSIYDITGKNVFSKTYNNNENTINISSLNKGIYFLQITSEDQTKIEKFIKL